MTPEDEKDPNCWVCHERGSQIFCPKCFLGFHIGCDVRTKEINSHDRSLNKMCYQCSKIEKSRHLYTSSKKFKSSIKRMLNSILDILLIRSGGIEPLPKIMEMDQQWGMFEDVKNFINFDTVRSKIENNEYECTEELLFDLRRIEHTMLVEFKVGHQTEDIADYISQISRFCLEIDLCPHCIYNYYLTTLGSASTCLWGHKLATVKYKSGDGTLDLFNMERFLDLPPYFPVKVIGYSKCRTFVYVRLFWPGRPWSLRVPMDNVTHLSYYDVERFHSLINNARNPRLEQDFRDALRKLNIHLEELKRKFGECDYPINNKRHWRPTDELFIDCDSSSTGRKRRSSNDSRKSIESRRQENSELKSWENQGAKPNKLTDDSSSRKRTLDIDLTNSPKKLARGKSEAQVSSLLPSVDLPSEALSDGSSTEVASSDESRLVLSSSETETVPSKDLSELHASPAHINMETSNGTVTESLTSCDKRVQSDDRTLLVDDSIEKNYSDDAWLRNSEKDEPSPSLNTSCRHIDLNSRSKNSSSSSINSTKDNSCPSISQEVQPQQENESISILLEDNIAESLPSPPLDRHRFEVTESDEEGELMSTLTHFACEKPFQVKMDEVNDQQETNVTQNSPHGMSEGRYPERTKNQEEAQQESSRASPVPHDISKKNLSASDPQRPIEVLSEGKCQNVSQGSESCEKIHPQTPIGTCLRCQFLEEELDKIESHICKYQDNWRALLEFCSVLNEQLDIKKI